MKTPSPQELAALVHRLKYLAGPTILTPCAESDAADALTAQAARIVELESECAELRKDKARLSWLDDNVWHGGTVGPYMGGETVSIQFGTKPRVMGRGIRPAIDAAMTAKPTEGRT